MSSRSRVQIAVALVVAVFAVGIWLTGGSIQPVWLRFYSAAVLVLTVAGIVWERWLWSTGLAQKMPGVPPDLRGTWKGKLKSEWTSPETGEGIRPKTAYVAIRQTASTVSVTQLTDESRSRSSMARVHSEPDLVSLELMFHNNPDSHLQSRSNRHDGASVLVVTNRPANRLKGKYWSDRPTKGELDFTDRRPQIADDYEQAKRLFKKPAK